MSPSPPKRRKLIAQARYFRLVEIDEVGNLRVKPFELSPSS